MDSENVLIPGKAVVFIASCSLRAFASRASGSPADFGYRPVRDRRLNTHGFGGLAFRHRSQEDEASPLDDGRHRSFWARQRSHEARRGGVVVVFIVGFVLVEERTQCPCNALGVELRADAQFVVEVLIKQLSSVPELTWSSH